MMKTPLKSLLRRIGHHNSIYDADYYARDVEGPATHAAPYVAQAIISRFSPRSLVDVGCGTGAMMAALKERGVSVEGFEYSDAGIKLCRQRGLDVTKFDIENDPHPAKKFDVAISLEVAEHILEKKASKYVSLLTSLAPIVLCTAAQPGQGGVDHVNCKPKQYWIDLFAGANARFDETSTVDLCRTWASNGVAGFYHDNLMVFHCTAPAKT
jgi:SAM-dependent methyltransferase